MLGKEIYIKTVERQKNFIENQLRKAVMREDGSTTYTYVGEIFKEVKEYFTKEGFRVTQINSPMITRGEPVYLFTINEESFTLTDEEKEEAKEYIEEDKSYVLGIEIPDDDEFDLEEFLKNVMDD